ncbi:MAG: hypothetical protein C0582_04695 [Alphaproteobacteria bacterium]|nr:MAG: hypothetical protein C0582_04695 [Alphaproteobacteria bacterium]
MRKTYKNLMKRGKGHDFDPKDQQLFNFKVFETVRHSAKKSGARRPLKVLLGNKEKCFIYSLWLHWLF